MAMVKSRRIRRSRRVHFAGKGRAQSPQALAPLGALAHAISSKMAFEPKAFTVHARVPQSLQPSPTEIESEFARHVGYWKRDVRHVSSVTKMVSHPSYRRIIGLGKPALPLLFGELQRQADHWFVALNAITGVDPVPPGATFSEAAESWLAWGQKKGYLPSPWKETQSWKKIFRDFGTVTTPLRAG
jgi:hypothetical protein